DRGRRRDGRRGRGWAGAPGATCRDQREREPPARAWSSIPHAAHLHPARVGLSSGPAPSACDRNVSAGLAAAARPWETPAGGDDMEDALAIILGGGRGTRLFPLTLKRSKPAVPIGGKYRLIDIPISNCLNSDLRQIFVLTQFNSESLNNHIGQ